MAAWLGGGSGSATDAFRAGVIGWLAGQGSGVNVSQTSVTAVPLGVLALVVMAVYTLARRLGAGSSITRLRHVLSFGATAGVCYAVLLALAASTVRVGGVTVSTGRAAVSGLVLAGVFAGLGAAQSGGLLAEGAARLPVEVRRVTRGAAYGAGLLLFAGLVVFATSLALDTKTLGRLWASLDPGLIGGVGLACLCLLLAPNLVLWAVAVLLGPGVAVGVDTSVTLTEVSLGQLPAFPLLAALPEPGAQPGWALALAALPLLAGFAAGFVAADSAPGWASAIVQGAAAGVAGAFFVSALLALSSGSIGPGRMAEVGPDPLICLGMALLTLGAGGTAGGALGHYRGTRAPDRAT